MTPQLIPSFSLAALVANDRNPRRITAARREGLRKSLDRHGNLGVLVARVLPDGTHRLVAGHQRLELLLEAQVAEAACWVVSCSDADETHLALTLNGHAGE